MSDEMGGRSNGKRDYIKKRKGEREGKEGGRGEVKGGRRDRRKVEMKGGR